VFESRGIQNSSTMRPNKPKGMIKMTPRKETRCPMGEGGQEVPFNNVRRRAHSPAESCSIIPDKAARQGWGMRRTPKRFGGAVIRRGECGLSAKNGRTRSLSARFLADPSAAPHGYTSRGEPGNGLNMSSLLLLVLLSLISGTGKAQITVPAVKDSVESLVMPEWHLFSPSTEVKHHEINKPDFGFS
jgi:hypothetical protein